jgi:integrase
VDALRGHLARTPARPDGLVFAAAQGGALNRSRVSQHFKRALAAAGLPPTVRFHDLRHAAASAALAGGADVVAVSRNLGHSRVSQTLDTYAHAHAAGLRKAAEALAAALVDGLAVAN